MKTVTRIELAVLHSPRIHDRMHPMPWTMKKRSTSASGMRPPRKIPLVGEAASHYPYRAPHLSIVVCWVMIAI